MRSLAASLAGLVVVLVLVGCSAGASSPGSLAGRTFLSISVTQDGVAQPLVPGTRIRIAFDAEGAIRASADCNTLGGSYGVDGGVLRVDGLAMTEMGCDPARHGQDEWLAKLLTSAPAVSLEGNDLVLTSGATVVRLRDREIADPDLPLVGFVWTVDAVAAGDAVSSVPGDVTATLRFGGDGRVELATGCNTGSASVSIHGDRIRFADVVLTRRACPGDAAELEAAVLRVLGADELVYRIESGTLWLESPEAALGLRASR